VQDRDMVAMED